MPSRDWTYRKFYEAAFSDVGFDVNSPEYIQRFELSHHAIETLQVMLYPLLSGYFRTKVPYTVPLPSKYLTAALSATYTASTATITSSSMNISFAAVDLQRKLVFRQGANIYDVIIASVVSGTQVTVTGNSLPSSDLTLDEILIPATTPVTTHLMLGQLRILRNGPQVDMSLESTVTNYVEPLSLEEFKTWRTSAINNTSKIVYCLNGDEILTKKGDSLTTFGTLTLYFPRVAVRGIQDSDYVDFPDGGTMQLALAAMKTTIAKRQKKDTAFYSAMLSDWIKFLYAGAKGAAETETIANRISALL